MVVWKYVCCHRFATVNPAPSPQQQWWYWAPHPEKWWDKHFCLSHQSWMMREYVTVINKYEFPGKGTASKSLTIWGRQQSNIRKSPKTINICEVWNWTLSTSKWQRIFMASLDLCIHCDNYQKSCCTLFFKFVQIFFLHFATSVTSLKSLLLSLLSINGIFYWLSLLPQCGITNRLTGFSLISITKNLNDLSPCRDLQSCFNLVLRASEWLNQRWTAFRRSISIS